MRFYLTLAVVLGIGFFAFKSCSEKLLPGSPSEEQPPDDKVESVTLDPKNLFAGVKPPLPPSLTDIQSPSISAQRDEPTVTRSYSFRNRPAPPVEFFENLSSSGVTVSVDPLSNSVVYTAPVSGETDTHDFLSTLDVVAGEAFVDAWVLFIREDNVRDFEASLAFGDLVPDLSATFSSGGFGAVLPVGKLRATLSYLANDGLLQVVDRPQLRISSGVLSRVSTGEDIPVPTTTFSNGLSTTAIEFRRVGLSFAVRPTFLPVGSVRLDVSAENGLLGASRNVGGVEVPSISTQSIASTATIGYDEAIILGGLESARRQTRFGLFGKSTEVQTGRLYLAVLLTSGYPKAKPVLLLEPTFPIIPPVDADGGQDYSGSVLPPRKSFFTRRFWLGK